MSKLKCAIIGCGNIAGGYDDPKNDLIRTHAKAFQENDKCELVCVFDPNEETAKNFALTWNSKKWFSNLEKMYFENKIDILSICSPTKFHYQQVEQAINNDISKIWLEKPATDTIESLEKINKLVKEKEVKVSINYFRQYDPGFLKVKSEIKNLGEIKNVRALYSKGLKHNGSHLIHLVDVLFGNITDFKLHSYFADETFPSVSGTLITPLTPVNIVAFDHNNFEIFEMDIIGTNGRIKVFNGGQVIEFEKVVKSKYYSNYKNLNLTKVHNDTYGFNMKNGLMNLINNHDMASLDDEIKIQKVIQIISSKTSEPL